MNFDKLNETDVREEIIAPLIRELGYRSDSNNNVIRELPLRYGREFLGRKDNKNDPVLRGRADYLLEAHFLVRWIIEAKSPAAHISTDDIEQAYTYANHAEVRAVYFVLVNGRQFMIFQTNLGPQAPPRWSVSYEELIGDTGKQILHNILAPDSIIRDNPEYVVDIGIPLGPRLRSFARVSGGFVRYTKVDPLVPALLQTQISIIGGSVERDTAGFIVIYLETQAPIITIDNFLAKNNLKTIELTSDSSVLSTNKDEPSRFVYSKSAVFPKGGVLHDLNTWQDVILQQDILVTLDFENSAVLEGEMIWGSLRFSGMLNGIHRISAEGNFCIFLS
jgi:hypothetical protein